MLYIRRNCHFPVRLAYGDEDGLRFPTHGFSDTRDPLSTVRSATHAFLDNH